MSGKDGWVYFYSIDNSLQPLVSRELPGPMGGWNLSCMQVFVSSCAKPLKTSFEIISKIFFKWNRYVQSPDVVAEQRCSECSSSEDLWICLICGYVGCGRYVGGHSHAHFLTTAHSYTMVGLISNYIRLFFWAPLVFLHYHLSSRM